MEKSDIIFKASFNEFSSSARDNVESSAYWLISICSGLRANFDKTQVIWIGARRGCGLELKTNTDIGMESFCLI
jgi:hypothetical protein